MRERLAALYHDAAAGRLVPQGHRWASALGVTLEAVHAGIVLVRESLRDRLHVRAAMLAYWTTVALVPILLLGFAVAGAAGLADSGRATILHFLYDTVLASSVEDVGTALDALLASASLGALGLVGVLALMGVGSQLYFQAELAYNDIFHVRVRRSWLARFLLFYGALTLGPVLIAAGFVASAQIGQVPGEALASRTLPVLLTAAAFVGAIKLLPCTDVRWVAALVGGLSSAVLFEIVKAGFGLYTDYLDTRDQMARIYGTVALLPVFLLWLYVLWLVVLFGVEVAFLGQNWVSLMDAQRRLATDPHAARRHPDGLFAARVMQIVCESWSAGRGPVGAPSIASAIGCELRHVQTALDVLEDARLVVESEHDTYVPARPPDRISTDDVLAAWQELAAPRASRSARPTLVRQHDSTEGDGPPHAAQDA